MKASTRRKARAGAGFYFDYSSLEETFMGTSGQGAEMPNPGVQSQFIAKSGGNQFSGEGYYDWYNNSLQGANIPQDVIDRGIREHSNEIDSYWDRAINVGGPIVEDKLWYFGTYRQQFNAVAQPQFRFDQTFDEAVEPGGEGHLPGEPEEQDHRLLPVRAEGPGNAPAVCIVLLRRHRLHDPAGLGQLGVPGEWNSTVTDKLYLEALLGISPATVETHRARNPQKLDIHNTAELVLYAVRRG